jgi:hypothetical protein
MESDGERGLAMGVVVGPRSLSPSHTPLHTIQCPVPCLAMRLRPPYPYPAHTYHPACTAAPATPPPGAGGAGGAPAPSPPGTTVAAHCSGTAPWRPGVHPGPPPAAATGGGPAAGQRPHKAGFDKGGPAGGELRLPQRRRARPLDRQRLQVGGRSWAGGTPGAKLRWWRWGRGGGRRDVEIGGKGPHALPVSVSMACSAGSGAPPASKDRNP